MLTRTVKLQIADFQTEDRLKCYEVSCQLRQLANHAWRLWEVYHTQRDSQSKLESLFKLDAEWRKLPLKEKQATPRPKWDVKPMPKELATKIRREVLRRFPNVHSRVVSIVLQRLTQTVCSKQSTTCNMKWWQAILLDRDSRAVAKRPQPIPIDGANATLEPADELGRVVLKFRADRIIRPTGKNATATLMSVLLKTDGKRAAYSQPAHEIANGLRQLKGSQIIYDDKKRKWFCVLTYEIDAEVPDLEDSVAILRAGRGKTNWQLRIRGRTINIGGAGSHVAHKRKGLLQQRFGRQASYRHAPPRKGHGRNRVMEPYFKLTQVWNNFTRRCNDGLTATVCKLLVEHKVSQLIYITGDDTRLLATAGKLNQHTESTGWPWYQVEQLLQQKLQRYSISCKSVKAISGRRASNLTTV